MKKFKRMISLVMVLILCMSLLPVNQSLLKAEAQLDDSTKLKNIILRIYDGEKWDNAELNPKFDPNNREYNIKLDIKYKKIQFYFEKASDDQVIEAKDINKCPVRDSNYTEEYSLRPQNNYFGFNVKSTNGSKVRDYVFTVKKGVEKNAHKVSATYSYRDLPYAFEGDIVKFKGLTQYGGKVFDKWIVETNNVTLDDPYRILGEFTMPNSEVKIDVQFKDSSDDGSKLRYIIVHAMKDNVWETFYDAVKIHDGINEYELNLSEGYTEAYITLQAEDILIDYDSNIGKKEKIFEECNKHIKTKINEKSLDIDDYSYGFRTKKFTLQEGENILNFSIISRDESNTSNYTLKINKGEVKYKVSFNANGAEGTMQEREIKKGAEYTLPENKFTVPENKEFAGWQIDGADKKPGDTITVNRNIKVKAIWKDIEYKVTFNNNEGTGEMPEQTVKKGEEYTLPENGFTAPENKEFAGWKIGDEDKKPGDKITINGGDIEVKAIWKDIQVKVSFNANQGSGTMEDVVLSKGSTYNLPESTFTAPTNKEFKAWSVNGEEKAIGDEITVDTDTEVKAIWKDIQVKVSFNANQGSGTMEDVVLSKGSTYNLPECTFTAPENKEFKAWSVNGEEKAIGDEITVDTDTEVKAIWKDIQVKVSFNANQGSGTMEDIVLSKCSTYNLPECTFTAPTNKEFKAWSVNGEEKAIGDEITVDTDTEVKAIWKDIQVKVSFNANQGSGTMEDVVLSKGSRYTLPACTFTAPENKEFEAWSVNDEEKAVGDEITINADTEVKAIWKDKPLEKFKVIIKANNGTNEAIVKEIEKGSDFEFSECTFTVPDGKVFKAWELDGQEYPAKTKIKINKETTVKAIWQDKPLAPDPEDENKKYEIKLMSSSNGKIIIIPTEAKEGELITVQAVPDYGYELESIIILDENQKLVPMKANQFTMPKGAVSIYAKFREQAPAVYPEREDEKPIENRRHRRNWYYDRYDEDKKTNDEEKSKEEKEIKIKESKAIITIGSQTLEKVDQDIHTVKTMDSAPYIKRGRTMLPLRYLAEALGYKVFWLGDTRTVLLTDLGLRVEIPIDTNLIIVNGIKYTSDVKPEIVKNKTMLPIANIARALGLKDGEDIIWDEVNRKVIISRKTYTK